jgi:hypothetical protein
MLSRRDSLEEPLPRRRGVDDPSSIRKEGGDGPGHSGRHEAAIRREDSLGLSGRLDASIRRDDEGLGRSGRHDPLARREEALPKSGVRRDDALLKKEEIGHSGRRDEEPKRVDSTIRREEAGHSGRHDAASFVGVRKEGSALLEAGAAPFRRDDRLAYSGPLERTLPRRDSTTDLRSGEQSRRESDSSSVDFGSTLRPRGPMDDTAIGTKEAAAAAGYRRSSVSSESAAVPEVAALSTTSVPVARRGSHSDLSATRGLSMSTSDLGAMGYKVASMSRLVVEEPGPKSPIAGDDLSHAKKAALRMQILELEAKTLEGLNGSRNGILAGLGKNCMKPGVSGKMGDAHKSQTESKS